jgi:hypothetical protein
MTTVDLPAGRVDDLEAKIDRLADQIAVLTADAEQRRRRRESFDDLAADLSRVAEGAMDAATRELESLSETADLADVVVLLRRVIEMAPVLERALVGLGAIAELLDDAAPIGSEVVATFVERLDAAERKGYFRFGSAVLGVADQVVTHFDEHDVELLGDNVVSILEAMREVTRPEMLAFVARAVDAVRTEQVSVEQEPVDPPSLLALARQLRDPDVRRGIARTLHTLRAVSIETGPRPATGAANPDHHASARQGGNP